MAKFFTVEYFECCAYVYVYFPLFSHALHAGLSWRLGDFVRYFHAVFSDLFGHVRFRMTLVVNEVSNDVCGRSFDNQISW